MFLSEHGQDGKCEPGNMAVQQQIGKEYRRGGKATEQILIVALAGLADILARICVLLYQRGHGGTRTLNTAPGAAGGACAVCLGRISAGGPSAAEFKIKEKTKGGPNHALHCQRAPL